MVSEEGLPGIQVRDKGDGDQVVIESGQILDLFQGESLRTVWQSGCEGKEGKRREEGRRNRKRKGWERKRGIKGRKKDFRF